MSERPSKERLEEIRAAHDPFRAIHRERGVCDWCSLLDEIDALVDDNLALQYMVEVQAIKLRDREATLTRIREALESNDYEFEIGQAVKKIMAKEKA